LADNIMIIPRPLAIDATLAALSAKITNPLPVSLSTLLNPHPVTQTTRTILLTKPEREDLLLETKQNWTIATATDIIVATVGQKIKVFALQYINNNADVLTQFKATVGGASKYWGSRLTKGIFAQTFTHPIVCDANTAFQFDVGSSVTVYVNVQYVKEA